ncbi:polyprenyl synthetase family protein [Sanguibacter sp. A247]|uniref:polyprenyl synthetase family protein n=1 Tax=unclassified Sanguibacter TaxID=2645534 RepID=UPI003FD7D07F
MSTPALVDRDDVRSRVDHLIDLYLTGARQDAVSAHSDDVDPLFDAMGRLLGGGKRLRAAFTYWAWRAFATDEGEAEGALRLGAALELFQAAALFHDDLMDQSDTRRGHATAHVHFARVHRAGGWPGSSSQFGLSAAVLLGDLALAGTERMLGDALDHLPERVGAPTRDIFDTMRTEVTLGQYLDVLSQVRPWSDDAEDDERRARAVIRAKSARYSVEHPLSLGAAAAGVDDETLAGVRRFGLPLGEAFQLRDDILGVFGDPATTGKPAGDDLREGKRTVLLARAFAGATSAEAAALRGLVGSPELSDDEIEDLRAIFVRTGALDGVERLVDSLADEAFAALDALGLSGEGATMLRALGYAAIERSA